ncbi:MAG: hypothetical protein IPH61_03225 [Bacteroidetes bacterium]|nr:hypothetical protein [Bacteroidota bacterium]MBK8486391.1 hypothetical protein [Bacteroidota bacterium]
MATERILTLLNVRQAEVWLVKRLFWLQFFQGIALAFFFTTTYAEFLHHFPITELWRVFILSAFLLWIFGFIYSKFEHRISPEKLSIYTTIFMAASMLVFQIIEGRTHSEAYFYWAVAWFNVLYLYNNFEFWGIASLLFNVRQSKRLFGVISAGEIPAKLIGYTLASLFVVYIGISNLMLAGVVSMLLSIPFLISIGKSGKIQRVVGQTIHHAPTGQVKTLVKKFTANKLILFIAILSFTAMMVDLLLNFAFYGEVKKAGYNDVELAQFIAIFLATARFFSLFFRLIFTSRIVENLGVKLSLLLTPIILLGLIASIFLIHSSNQNTTYVFYALGITCIIIEIFRSSVNTPVFLSLIQPLHAHDRLRAHNVIKGIMDPFSYLLVGAFIVALLSFEIKIDWQLILVTVIIPTLGWMAMVFAVNQQYFITLFNNLSARTYHPGEFNLVTAETLSLIKSKIKTAPHTELVHLLRMLRGNDHPEVETIIKMALTHSDENVIAEGLLLAEFNAIPSIENELLRILENESYSSHLRKHAAELYSKTSTNTKHVTQLMDHADEEIRKVVVANLVHSNNEFQQKRSIEKLREYISSNDYNNKKYAAKSLVHAVHDSGRNLLITLMHDADNSVAVVAIHSAGENAHPQLLESLVQLYPTHTAEVIKAFQNAKEKSFPYIQQCINMHVADSFANEKLIALCGRIKGVDAVNLLIELLNTKKEYKEKIIKALRRCNYKAKGHMLAKTEELIESYFAEADESLHMQHAILPLKDKYIILMNALQLELDIIRESVLNLFTFIYNTEHIEEVRLAFHINESHTLANAFELLEMNVSKNHVRHFSLLFETEDLQHRWSRIKLPDNIMMHQIEDVMIGVLNNRRFSYLDWTKSCSLYTEKKNSLHLEKNIVLPYTKAHHPVLKETAIFALS